MSACLTQLMEELASAVTRLVWMLRGFTQHGKCAQCLFQLFFWAPVSDTGVHSVLDCCTAGFFRVWPDTCVKEVSKTHTHTHTPTPTHNSTQRQRGVIALSQGVMSSHHSSEQSLSGADTLDTVEKRITHIDLLMMGSDCMERSEW